tara:strand:+ start:405 stop:551 length:147 start_codon:yes stop_codon:yes gene_type:complete
MDKNNNVIAISKKGTFLLIQNMGKRENAPMDKVALIKDKRAKEEREFK